MFENCFEKWVYENASILMFTNGKVVDYLVSKYPFLKRDRLWVIEQGFDHRFGAERENEGHRNSLFTLIYTGTFIGILEILQI